MNDFVSKEIEKIYQRFKNNERLQKSLDDNYLILKRQDYIGEYTETAFKAKIADIDNINKDKLYSLAALFYENEKAINETEISILVDNSFLRKEISDIYEGVEITNDTLKELFYCFKYCTVTSFFQNNKKYFMPDYDLRKLEENGKLSVFTDALLKEFDKLNHTLSEMKDIIDIDNIDNKYLTYMSQLLGYEKKDIPALNEESFRELVKNIIEIYKIKGTNYSFELFFNFLGFNIEIQEFFFDRRYFYRNGGNNEFTGEKSVLSYNHYLTTIDPMLNVGDIFTRTETVNYCDIGQQFSLLEFDDLVKTYGAEAVLGYSKLDKNNRLYTGNVYTYFKTNYIYYNVTLPDRYPSAEEIVAITSYLNFLSPVYIMKTLETQSSEEESDTMTLDLVDWQSRIIDGVMTTPTREYIIYNYTNSMLGQNYGKKLIFSRMFNYTTTINGTSVSFLEVRPYPDNPYEIQNEWYIPNNEFVDITATKAFMAAHPEAFGKKIDIVTSLTKNAFLADDSLFVQDFDNTNATDIKALVPVKYSNRSFKKTRTVKQSLYSPIYVYNNITELNQALLLQNFRENLYDGFEVAIRINGTNYDIYRYGFDINSIHGALSNPIAAITNSKANYSFETLSEAQTFIANNKINYGDKIFVNEKSFIYTYNYINDKNTFIETKNYSFDNIAAARTYFNNNPTEILLNVEFYLKSDFRTYRFIHKNRKPNQLVWSSEDKALYSFINSTNDLSFKEIDLTGLILEISGTSYIVDDPAYNSYNEIEDKQNFIFYNFNHKERPNNYKSFTEFEISNLPFLIKYYASTYYSSLSYKEQRDLRLIIDNNSSYETITLPEVLMNIYSGTYVNDDNLLNLIVDDLETKRDGVVVYNGENIITTPNDIKIRYDKLIDFVEMFIGYDPAIEADKTALIAMFADKEYVEKVVAWREKYFNDDSLNTAIIEPDRDIVLGNKKAYLSNKFGKLRNSINNFSSDSFSYYDEENNIYYKPKIPFYGFSNSNNKKICFYVLENDLKKVCDINLLLRGTTATFCNAVYYQNFQKNYKQFIINDVMKIPFENNESSIYRITLGGRKFIAIQTSTIVDGSMNLYSMNIEGHLYFNSFSKYLKNNVLVYSKGNSAIPVDEFGTPTRYVSWGYDKDFSIVLENKKDLFEEFDTTLNQNNEVIISTSSNDLLKSSKGSDIIDLSYIPQKLEVTFDCGGSEVNNNPVFIINGGSASSFEEGSVIITCGGA